MMNVTFGKHMGKSVELLMLKEPSYIKWILEQESPRGAMASVQAYTKHLVLLFDQKPLIEQCCSKTCKQQATRLTVYLDNLLPHWWCHTCDPYQTGANAGKLQSPMGYLQALRHVEVFCNNRKPDYSGMINAISQGKGLPRRVGETQAKKFFRD
jgi:hypothetical protein